MKPARAGRTPKATVEAAAIRIVRTPNLDDPERAATRARIESILRAEQITSVLQPIVAMRGRRHVVGVEALSRFPATPIRPPNEWFAEATSVGLGEELELLAIKNAMTHLDSLPEHIYVSVNVSPATVVNASLAVCFWGVDWSRVVVEITEHAPIEDFVAIQTAVAPLKRMGARLAVDDAGAGFASLRQILSLEPDIIKLDIAMAREVASDRGSRAMVAALVSFARESGALVVAEGIETYEQMDALRDLGVDYGQGFLIGRPQIPLSGRG